MICIAEKVIETDQAGLRLAKEIKALTGNQLCQIFFWHHVRDEHLKPYQINYRKGIMLDIIKNIR